jgi:pimeloyl-ACP methyl ester carboxylesterase
VRVLQVPQRDGSSAWVAVIPGTQAWSPRAGANPFDLTSDVLLLAQRQTLLAAGVERALTLAQRDAGRAGRSDPVMLAGHSQGGIVAAALAADDGFRARHRVTHVVTTGAPVARLALPPTVSVLSLEHTQDVVPRLEGRPNADRRSHVTVTRDLRGDPEVAGRAAAAHSTAAYIATAAQADRAGSASLSAWREGAAAFLGDGSSSAQVRDYRVWREEGVAR